MDVFSVCFLRFSRDNDWGKNLGAVSRRRISRFEDSDPGVGIMAGDAVITCAADESDISFYSRWMDGEDGEDGGMKSWWIEKGGMADGFLF